MNMRKRQLTDTELLMSKLQQEPHDYACCVNEDCQSKSQCLRYLQYQAKGREFFLRIINPRVAQHIGNTKCNMYADATHPGTYAVGFERFVRRLNPDEKLRFQCRCMHHFCKTVYYNMRAGKRIIYPWEQDTIRDAARKEGIDFPEHGWDHEFQAPAWW